MTPIPKLPRIVSDLIYNDYVVLLCYTDAEWSRRRFDEKAKGLDLLRRRQQNFTTKCTTYKDAIDANYHAYATASGYSEHQHVAPFLFNPACYVPFDHADDLAVVLLDAFDAVHYLTAETRTAVEKVSLAFSPRLSSFYQCGPDTPLCELDAIGGGFGVPERIATDKSLPAVHPFQLETPLLAFTKYKVHGLATVGPALLFQQILLKAMAVRIQETIETLRSKVLAAHSYWGGMTIDDVNSAKCVFLDLQGSEELGTMVFCRNYAVAMTLVAALKTLTYADVFSQDADGVLQEIMADVKTLRAIARLKPSKQHTVVPLDIVRSLHVFHWTDTSLAVSQHAYADPMKSNCTGVVEATSLLRISPGHRAQVETLLACQSLPCNSEDVRERIASLKQADYYCCQSGIDDMSIPCVPAGDKAYVPLIDVKSVLLAIAQYRNSQPDGAVGKKARESRHIVETMTSVGVPVPKLTNNDVDMTDGNMESNHFSPLAVLLPRIQRRLCYTDEMTTEEKNILEKQNAHLGRLDLLRLKQVPREYGVPVTLRRTIEYLYQDFAISIADPVLFDAVLDLYDVFATCHKLLTDCLPVARRAETRYATHEGMGYLDEERVADIAFLIDAMHNGLMHRVAKSFPEASIRDMAIDFRGGLSQVLFAADAPLKCGLGLLRKYAKDMPETKPADYARNTVGGITRISFTPGTRCHPFVFGTEDKVQLAAFEADVAHVLDVDSYCDNLHESFHLIFNLLPETRDLRFPEDSVMRDRISEVFSHLLCQMFLFGPDTEAFLCYTICNYSKSLVSVGRDDCETIVRFWEFAFQLFMVVDAVPQGDLPAYSWNNCWYEKPGGTAEAQIRFDRMLEEYGSLHSEYSRLWGGRHRDDIRSYCNQQFSDIYPLVVRFMPQIWHAAVSLYQRFSTDNLLTENGVYKYADMNLDEQIKNALATGQPLIRTLCRPFVQTTDNYIGDANSGLDPITLIAAVLHCYARQLVDGRGKAMHLYRHPITKNVSYPKRIWWEFQIDKGATELFCPVPASRRRRLRSQIAVLKTFWDVSANLRERRLWEMIADTCPELMAST